MAEVMQSSPSHFPSPSSSSSTPCAANDGTNPHALINRVHEEQEEEEEEGLRERERKERGRESDQLPLLAILVSAFRKSLVGCSISGVGEELCSSMEIGVPTNVRHVAHVTFDRFHGFLGLPVEFEPEVPRRAPSASATVFGVSTDSMQLSYDPRGNSVPTILLMMQRHLYAQGGLQAEGIFRINGENSHEEYVREQLNGGIVPDNIDVHCLAGLIKAWFRELPTGVLDSLSSEQVMQSESEEECAQLMRLLPPTEAALLDWALNLMADVAQMEHLNKMNARNIAMVFAPNMTQMSDPLTALMYAVQVMNFLKMLIVKTLRERQESSSKSIPISPSEPSDQNGDSSSPELHLKGPNEEANTDHEEQKTFVSQVKDNSATKLEPPYLLSSVENLLLSESHSLVRNCPCDIVSHVNNNGAQEKGLKASSDEVQTNLLKAKNDQPDSLNIKKGSNESKGSSIVGRVTLRMELYEAWR